MVTIEPKEPVAGEGTVTRRASVTGSMGADELRIEIPTAIAGDLDDHSHLVGHGIWPAVLARADLHIGATVESGHTDRVRRLLHVYRSWVPALPLPEVTVDGERAPGPASTTATGTAAYFSRGVDSMFEAALDTRARPPLTHLVFLDGIEPRHSPPVAAGEIEAASAAAELLGIPLSVVRTNAHALTDHARDWADVHGCVLAALATSLGGEIGEVVIPSTDSYATLVPYGSHPLLDPLLSTSAITVRHGDLSAGRAGKVAALAAQRPDLLPYLKVCFAEDRVDNCGRCGKCIITMAALMGVGALDAATGFPGSIDLDQLRAFRPSPLQSRQHWIDVVRLLDDTGRAPEVRDAILHALRRAARPDVKGWAAILRSRRTGERSTLHPSWKDPTRGIDWTNHTDVLRVLDEGWSERLGHPLPPLPEPLRPR
jgi:hypothetical protein